MTGEQLVHPNLDALCEALDQVRAARPAAVRVVTVVDDPNANAQKVGTAVEGDPALTAQLMKLANSAFYGMSGRVGNTGFAVTLIGFSAVRSLAAVTATGMDRAETPKPPGFWEHAAATAAGCSAVAPRFGVPTSDAFAAGLLHDLGTALLYRFDRAAHQDLLTRFGDDGVALRDAEAGLFGLGHDEAAARVLGSWRFPDDLVAAIATHHQPPAVASRFATAIMAGDALAQLSVAGSGAPAGDGVDPAELLISVGIEPFAIDGMVESTRRRADEILAGLPAT